MKYPSSKAAASERAVSVFYFLLFTTTLTGCILTNTFDPPKNLPKSDQIKRLIIFRASVVKLIYGGNQTQAEEPLHPIIVRQNGDKRLMNLRQPLSGNCSYVFEMEVTDTGNMTFLMGSDRKPFGQKLFTDTTIYFNDLKPGDNYWHLNYYLERFRKIGLAPVLTLKEIDTSKDYFRNRSGPGFRFALRYNLSADSIIYEKKKAIVSNQKSIKRIYKKMMENTISVDSISANMKN